MATQKLYPFSVQKHAHDIEYRKNRVWCTMRDMESGETNPPENLVQIVTRHFGFGEYKHIEPVASTALGCVGWMDGGAIAHTSDSRFSRLSQYPLCVHDRQETQQQYDAMFD